MVKMGKSPIFRKRAPRLERRDRDTHGDDGHVGVGRVKTVAIRVDCVAPPPLGSRSAYYEGIDYCACLDTQAAGCRHFSSCTVYNYTYIILLELHPSTTCMKYNIYGYV